MWLSRALYGNAIDEVLDPLLVLIEHLVLLGAKPARSKAVHRNAVLAPVVGQTHRQLPHTAAAGSVGRQACIAEDARYRTDVDDAAIAMRHHATRHLLRDKEGSTQVRVEHHVPIVPGHIESGFPSIASGVVDQNMDLPPGLFGCGGHLLDAALIAYIQ